MAVREGSIAHKYEISMKSQMEMIKRRDSGQEYVSTNGKIIPAKIQPDIFCLCPQKCQRKLPKEMWKELFRQFYGLKDHLLQNQFLQSHILIKTIHLHNWAKEKQSTNNKRRVTCKYQIPILEIDETLRNYCRRKADRTVEVCQKAFMNVFGITEKRVRMQRERCIATMAANRLALSPTQRISQEETNLKENCPEEKKDSDMNPLNLSIKEDSEENEIGEKPLDLSNHMERSLRQIEIDKTQLYEIAEKMGISREIVDKEMSDKFEEMVRKNLRKQHKELLKTKKQNGVETSAQTLRGISQQVVGLNDDLTILPIQTLNNGDLTITPILGPGVESVENCDIMRVNIFFQNQLWKPEYIGLERNQKFWPFAFDQNKV